MSDPTAPGATSTGPPQIHRLSTRLINQIAAGEVVTRPGAALKELIENSLDAGARRIELTIEDDALSFTVRDDGGGIGEGELPLAIERYATSKISELDDLMRLVTRGFRGEALAAISAVSRLEIVTRRPDEPEGRRLRTSGGRDVEIVPCAANPGTTINVRDLFYNTPVRLKFLKSAVSEWGHMLQAIVRQALTRPDVGFAIRWRGRPYLDLPAGQSLADRFAQVVPAEAGRDLLAVDHTLHEVRVHGVVGGPSGARRDRRHQFFFANGRPIHFRPLPFALEEAFRGLLMTQRYPVAALLIELPPDMVDVNVHPTKEEVRFREESLVAGAVHRAVAEALRAANLVPTLTVPGPAPAAEKARAADRPALIFTPTPVAGSAAPPAAGASGQLDFVPGFALGRPEGAAPARPYGESESAGAAAPAAPAGGDEVDPAAREEAGLLARLRRLVPPPAAIAQVGDCYILAEAGADGMLVIDQHAAHEKYLYLKFMQESRGTVAIQPLLIPQTVEVAPQEAAALEGLLPALSGIGFEIEPFGGGTFLIQALPVLFERLDATAFLRDLIDDIGGGDLPREMRRLRERICARAACRAAVKAGDRLAREEMQRLVDQLLSTEGLLRCPHGRPTTLLLTRDQLDRQFGRLG